MVSLWYLYGILMVFIWYLYRREGGKASDVFEHNIRLLNASTGKRKK